MSFWQSASQFLRNGVWVVITNLQISEFSRTLKDSVGSTRNRASSESPIAGRGELTNSPSSEQGKSSLTRTNCKAYVHVDVSHLDFSSDVARIFYFDEKVSFQNLKGCLYQIIFNYFPYQPFLGEYSKSSGKMSRRSMKKGGICPPPHLAVVLAPGLAMWWIFAGSGWTEKLTQQHSPKCSRANPVH